MQPQIKQPEKNYKNDAFIKHISHCPSEYQNSTLSWFNSFNVLQPYL